jgi:hypothetical protein
MKLDSPDQRMNAVNRGAAYGWLEALKWVLTDKTVEKSRDSKEKATGEVEK